MAKKEFDVPKQFGKNRVNLQVLATGFGVPLIKSALLNIQKQGEEVEDEKEGESLFGLPLYGILFITKPNFIQYEYDEYSKIYRETPIILQGEDRGDTGLLFDGVIVELTQTKNIVTTAISGGRGTVKEYINEGDYNITIRGFIASKNADVFPKAKVMAFSNYLKAPVPLKIENKYLNDVFDIYEIVITDYNLFQQEGMRNVQYFEVSGLSDFSNNIKQKDA